MTRGRPKKFNHFDALEKAVRLFWEKGYEGASLNELIEVMSISRQSMYNSFGNKRDLFIQCLEYYIHNSSQDMKKVFESSDHAEVKLTQFIEMILGYLSDENSKGCFASVAVQEMAQKDPEIKRILDKKYDNNREMFQRFFTSALENNEIESALNGTELAYLFDSILLGMTGLCKLPGRQEQMKMTFNSFLKQINFKIIA